MYNSMATPTIARLIVHQTPKVCFCRAIKQRIENGEFLVFTYELVFYESGSTWRMSICEKPCHRGFPDASTRNDPSSLSILHNVPSRFRLFTHKKFLSHLPYSRPICLNVFVDNHLMLPPYFGWDVWILASVRDLVYVLCVMYIPCVITNCGQHHSHCYSFLNSSSYPSHTGQTDMKPTSNRQQSYSGRDRFAIGVDSVLSVWCRFIFGQTNLSRRDLSNMFERSLPDKLSVVCRLYVGVVSVLSGSVRGRIGLNSVTDGRWYVGLRLVTYRAYPPGSWRPLYWTLFMMLWVLMSNIMDII